MLSILLCSSFLTTRLVASLFPMQNTPGVISLFAGQPNQATFPITSFSFNVRSPDDWSKEKTITMEGGLLDSALQYGEITEFLEWIWGLQELSHGRKKGEEWAKHLLIVHIFLTDCIHRGASLAQDRRT